MIRVEIPFHLRTLARVSGEIKVRIEGKPTIGSLLDAFVLLLVRALPQAAFRCSRRHGNGQANAQQARRECPATPERQQPQQHEWR